MGQGLTYCTHRSLFMLWAQPFKEPTTLQGWAGKSFKTITCFKGIWRPRKTPKQQAPPTAPLRVHLQLGHSHKIPKNCGCHHTVLECPTPWFQCEFYTGRGKWVGMGDAEGGGGKVREEIEKELELNHSPSCSWAHTPSKEHPKS